MFSIVSAVFFFCFVSAGAFGNCFLAVVSGALLFLWLAVVLSWLRFPLDFRALVLAMVFFTVVFSMCVFSYDGSGCVFFAFC